MNCRAVIIHFVQVRPFILYCLFNEPPELYMFEGGGNKNKNKFKLQWMFYVVGNIIVVRACGKNKPPLQVTK